MRACIPWGWRKRKDITGEIVLITGAGSGMGRLMAVEFAKRNAVVVLWDINEPGRVLRMAAILFYVHMSSLLLNTCSQWDCMLNLPPLNPGLLAKTSNYFFGLISVIIILLPSHILSSFVFINASVNRWHKKGCGLCTIN